MKYEDLIGQYYNIRINLKGKPLPRELAEIKFYFGKKINNENAIIYWYENNIREETDYEISFIINCIKKGKWIVNKHFYRKLKLKKILND